MKRIILFILIICQSFANAMAQRPCISLGMEGGTNMNKILGQSFKQKFNFNYYVGAFSNLGLTKKFGIQPELLFIHSTATTSNKFYDIYSEKFLWYDPTNHGISHQASLDYLSIPILASMLLIKGVYLQAGPQFSFLIYQNKDLVPNRGQAFKTGNFSLVGGIWIKFPFHINFIGRYVIGVNNINNFGNQDKWTIQCIQLGIGTTL